MDSVTASQRHIADCTKELNVWIMGVDLSDGSVRWNVFEVHGAAWSRQYLEHVRPWLRTTPPYGEGLLRQARPYLFGLSAQDRQSSTYTVDKTLPRVARKKLTNSQALPFIQRRGAERTRLWFLDNPPYRLRQIP